MPAKAPTIAEAPAARLKLLGLRLRAYRKQHKLSATATAEAAGMSRVTLNRIERGEPSVTMGAYVSAMGALGLALEMAESPSIVSSPIHETLPELLRLEEFPQLKRLSWHMRGVTDISPVEALSLYERNWRHVDQAGMIPTERALVKRLADELGGGRLLV